MKTIIKYKNEGKKSTHTHTQIPRSQMEKDEERQNQIKTNYTPKYKTQMKLNAIYN